MTRGMRMMLVLLFLIGVILLMMDCAKKSMRLKKPQKPANGTSQSWKAYPPIFNENVFAASAQPRSRSGL
jgi:hypothetical protein